jgi:hypothetical protein
MEMIEKSRQSDKLMDHKMNTSHSKMTSFGVKSSSKNDFHLVTETKEDPAEQELETKRIYSEISESSSPEQT